MSSSGAKNPTNAELQALVEKAGVSVSVLATPEQVVCDDEWTPERERLAQEHLRRDTSTIPEFWQHKYEAEAARNWDKFYKRNSTNFYKDRYVCCLCGGGEEEQVSACLEAVVRAPTDVAAWLAPGTTCTSCSQTWTSSQRCHATGWRNDAPVDLSPPPHVYVCDARLLARVSRRA